ncbi:unnamed protein product [Cyprideis torosa]|uniref:Uncharacterized protein n=1 Tax=Cyprideis torosa TaxID=163714 RepID=A0A7R8WCU2_9CRUS|nr:unnamed protein product [Cyprideis torosa]CAG0893801.1 unnamed protein product [Cyprideis torosa]
MRLLIPLLCLAGGLLVQAVPVPDGGYLTEISYPPPSSYRRPAPTYRQPSRSYGAPPQKSYGPPPTTTYRRPRPTYSRPARPSYSSPQVRTNLHFGPPSSSSGSGEVLIRRHRPSYRRRHRPRPRVVYVTRPEDANDLADMGEPGSFMEADEHFIVSEVVEEGWEDVPHMVVDPTASVTSSEDPSAIPGVRRKVGVRRVTPEVKVENMAWVFLQV